MEQPRKAGAEPPVKNSYRDGNIPIGGMSFDLQPRFSGGRLNQVWLFSAKQCGRDASAVFSPRAAGLTAKCPQVLLGAPELRESDLAKEHVLKPREKRIKMRLILGTHSRKGVEVFRDVVLKGAVPDCPTLQPQSCH